MSRTRKKTPVVSPELVDTRDYKARWAKREHSKRPATSPTSNGKCCIRIGPPEGHYCQCNDKHHQKNTGWTNNYTLVSNFYRERGFGHRAKCRRCLQVSTNKGPTTNQRNPAPNGESSLLQLVELPHEELLLKRAGLIHQLTFIEGLLFASTHQLNVSFTKKEEEKTQ